MKYREYIEDYIKYYRVDGLLEYRRCSGVILFYKKILIYILKTRFYLSYSLIGTIFKNNHTTIMYHYKDILGNPDLTKIVDEALKLYKEGK